MHIQEIWLLDAFRILMTKSVKCLPLLSWFVAFKKNSAYFRKCFAFSLHFHGMYWIHLLAELRQRAKMLPRTTPSSFGYCWHFRMTWGVFFCSNAHVGCIVACWLCEFNSGKRSKPKHDSCCETCIFMCFWRVWYTVASRKRHLMFCSQQFAPFSFAVAL